jgi:hypothetical protein
MKVKLVLMLLPVFLVACGGGGEEVEKAEEEAGVEEVVEPSPEETRVEEVVEPAKPTPEEIQAKGCPEGQISNEAGTECRPIEEHEREASEQERKVEEQERKEAEEWVRSYEAGEIWPNRDNPAPGLQLECQTKKAFIEGGNERVNEIIDPVFERAERNAQAKKRGEAEEEGPDLSEALANAGYTCERTPWAKGSKSR